MRPARALATRAAAAAEEFATGTSSAYADAQYLAWQRDPASVHSSWASYFASGAFALPPQLGGAPAAGAAAAAQVPAGDAESTLQGLTGADTARAMHLIAAYQRRGHERADLDPLRLAGDRPRLRDLDPATYGFEPGDADRPLRLASAPGSAVAGCVEINQCVGCSFLGDDAAVLAPSSGEEPALPRHRTGTCSLATPRAAHGDDPRRSSATTGSVS